MRIITHRVVQPGSDPNRKTGINAYCYLHPGQRWLDEPPPDLGAGVLVNQIIEVDPPRGNRVRSFLDIIAPDETSNRQIVGAISDGASLLADGNRELPWSVSHGEIRFRFDAEQGLVAQWQIELGVLIRYALAVRRMSPNPEV